MKKTIFRLIDEGNVRLAGVKKKVFPYLIRKKNGKKEIYYVGKKNKKSEIEWERITREVWAQTRFEKARNYFELKQQRAYAELDRKTRTIRIQIDENCKKFYEEAKKVAKRMPVEIKKYRPDGCIYKTDRGEYVRSKSELFIANALYKFGIPYEYEQEMFDGIMHPDFVIKDNIRGETIIWEHFGMMNDPEYVYQTLKKKKFYKENGFEENINMICTYEFLTGDGVTPIAFGSAEAEEIVREWFVPED